MKPRKLMEWDNKLVKSTFFFENKTTPYVDQNYWLKRF